MIRLVWIVMEDCFISVLYGNGDEDWWIIIGWFGFVLGNVFFSLCLMCFYCLFCELKFCCFFRSFCCFCFFRRIFCLGDGWLYFLWGFVCFGLLRDEFLFFFWKFLNGDVDEWINLLLFFCLINDILLVFCCCFGFGVFLSVVFVDMNRECWFFFVLKLFECL